ncbi:outer membrane beta-barrel protein [Rhodocytophaga aerolata]|uniref:Outer membrane beta-barrel protein n=1 Tax=Rhodocytophaga aerolata TaxID=455078 RepID=A0ABT8RGY6_9BACT|nr:outer membrane beta-barrel protein [Rhodocytophaga aerolata]MDO1450040.1 outer membrane beta-barrel protein [Rhodocytophaga aerolata]
MKKVLYFAMLLCSLATTKGFTQAQDSTETDKSTFSISGYIDSYYFTNFNRPASRDNMGQSGVGRGFDRRVDQFSLGMVQTIFRYTNRKSEMVADLAFGPNAQYGNYGNVPVLEPRYGYAIGNDNFSAILIKQAYFKYNATDKLSFTLGQFGTHIGYELIDAPLNFHYSINHTFNSGIPFYHTGLKANYAITDYMSLMVGVANGFDYMYDNNRAKAIIGQLAVSPADGFNIYFNYMYSKEANADSLGRTPNGNFTVYDLNGSYQLTDNFLLGFWGMIGTQKGVLGSPGTFIPADDDTDELKTWGGVNLYGVYTFSDLFSLGFRGEFFDNTSGARGLRNIDSFGTARGARATTWTLTGNFTLADGHILLKPELRLDNFNKIDGASEVASQQFMDADGNFTKNSQTTFGMAAIYKF